MTPSVLLYLWISALICLCHSCPELCSCSDKHQRHFAECSFKHLVAIPEGLPRNLSTLSLSANRISVIEFGSFDNVTQITSLWMAHNEIVTIEPWSLVPLIHLRNFDISHNKIVDFPWEDLQNLTNLQLLKMNHNEMVTLPQDAFLNLKDLRSLRLNNNRFHTIAEGTFDGLVSLSHLQLYNNPFVCSCFMDWLREWILKTTISVDEQNLIVCASPRKLKGMMVKKLPEAKCMAPNITITSEPNIDRTTLYEGTMLILTCETTGNPKPEVFWKIRSKQQNAMFALPTEEGESAESNESFEDLKTVQNPIRIFPNGSIAIFPIRLEDTGIYSCSATNEFGKAHAFLSVEVVEVPTFPPTPKLIETITTKTNPSDRRFESKSSIFDIFHSPSVDFIPTLPPSIEVATDSSEEFSGSVREPSHASKCGLSSDTEYISNHAFNTTLDDIKQYTFDFGVIALGVSKTEVKVRVNPLLLPRDKMSIRLSTSEGFHSIEKEPSSPTVGSRGIFADGLYLCLTADHRHTAVQWSRIEDGINTYLFKHLHPGTNYSLCLSYRGEDCDVQVLFTTRKTVPDLLVIISVSICLLTVSTVPLLGATCFHLVYKYRSKTYKLIMKAKDQYHMERSLGANFNIRAPYAESQRHITSSVLDVGEEESVSGEREKERNEEGSVATESFTLSQYRGNLDDFEVGSEYSDRLPLGAEAVNITSNYK